MGRAGHQGDVGRRVLAESIQLQQRLSGVPLPPEPPRRPRRSLHVAAAVLLALVLVALGLLLPPSGAVS